MAKDKKKKKDKKQGKSGAAAALASNSLKSLTQNPLVADIVAATLVGAAAALKDSNKARQLASNAGDELEKLSRKSAERGNAMWQLALDIGRRAADTLAGEAAARGAKTRKKTGGAKSSKAAKAAKPSSSAKKSARKSAPKRGSANP